MAGRSEVGGQEGGQGGVLPVTMTPLLTLVVIKTLTTSFGPYKNLVLTSLGTARFDGNMQNYDRRMVLGAILFCSWRLEFLEAFQTTRRNTLVLGEIGSPFLPETCYVSAGEAVVILRKVLHYAIARNVCTSYCLRLNTNTYAAISTSADNPINRHGLPDAYPFTEVEIMAFSGSQGFKFLDICSEFMDDGDDDRLGLTLLTNFIVAVCKQLTRYCLQ